MEVGYEDPKFEALVSNERALRKKFGAGVIKSLARRHTSLRGAATLAELHRMPGRTHPLRGDRAGTFAMELPGGFRLILRPTPPVPTLKDGGIDLDRVTRVTLVEISAHYA